MSLNVPGAVGSNVTVTVTAPPGAIVEPTAGTPEAPNGALGRCTALIVSGALPTFLNVALPDRCPPTAVPPNGHERRA